MGGFSRYLHGAEAPTSHPEPAERRLQTAHEAGGANAMGCQGWNITAGRYGRSMAQYGVWLSMMACALKYGCTVPWRVAGESYSYAAVGRSGLEAKSDRRRRRPPCWLPLQGLAASPAPRHSTSASSQKSSRFSVRFLRQKDAEEGANVPRLGPSADSLPSSAQVWQRISVAAVSTIPAPGVDQGKCLQITLTRHDIPTNTPIAKISCSHCDLPNVTKIPLPRSPSRTESATSACDSFSMTGPIHHR
ncbi:uncharacterized protein PAC_14660 [Phialocephala subalpina]|uniref:Uncharacterized protein n=1 Tax=Phialocephala subalpina TaxID=576137 RepID=A0A1L7XIA1_9HELO|nr:uncharacterized protein PAC_14660 [Phialocephala subalpina]